MAALWNISLNMFNRTLLPKIEIDTQFYKSWIDLFIQQGYIKLMKSDL